VTLDLDGLSVVYAHGPIRSTSVTWPGQTDQQRTLGSIRRRPAAGLQATGPWALFRLFAQGTLQQSVR
jgi:type VI secretion system protein ImpL